jgi:hypothetical protein
MAQYNNSENVFQWSFPANHLITVTLSREIRLNETWPQSARSCYFFFFNMIAGVKTSENSFGKTYDFKQTYSMKFSPEEIIGLANALKYAATGNLVTLFGGWQKFANLNNNVKTFSLFEIAPNEKNKIRGAGLAYSQQNPSAKLTYSLSSSNCISMSEVLLKMGQRAIDYELDRMEKIVKSRTSTNEYINQQTERRGFESPPPQFETDTPRGFKSPAPQFETNIPSGFNQHIQQPQNQFGFNNGDNPFEDISADFGNMLGGL